MAHMWGKVVTLLSIFAHWNKNNDKRFKEVFRKNEYLFGKFFEAKTKFEIGCDFKEILPVVKEMVEVIGGKGIQNTKISKILHVLAPTLIPMIDPEQGKFILGKGNHTKTNRNHLIEAFKKFHQSFAKNRKRIEQIGEQLKGCNIKITKLRIFELLIWLQTQCNKKDIEIKLISAG